MFYSCQYLESIYQQILSNYYYYCRCIILANILADNRIEVPDLNLR